MTTPSARACGASERRSTRRSRRIAARDAAASDADRATEVARVRDAAERAASGARRVEGLLGKRRQGSLEGRIVAATAVLGRIDVLLEAAAEARDAVGERAAALERRMLAQGDAEDVTAQLRECSQAEAELQAQLHATAETVTEAEVRAAHLRDRRDEAAAELERDRQACSGSEARAGDGDARRTGARGDRAQAGAARSPPRGARARQPARRARVRGGARARRASSRSSAQDLEAALAELDGLIRDTDRKITTAFEETFEATQRNFEELVEHLFPGGRGRLRLVDDAGPAPGARGRVRRRSKR